MDNALGTNIKRYRTILGYNQSLMAEKTGLSRPAYAAIESGRSEPKASNLMKIADVLKINIQDLFEPLPQFQSLRFRKNAHATSKEESKREQVLIAFNRELQDYNFLIKELNKPKENWIINIMESDPVSAAMNARKSAGLHDHEVISNICSIIEKFGLVLSFIDSDSRLFFGFSVGNEDNGPAICVNTHESISIERQIFTIAHELGHIILHKASYSGTISDAQDDKEEKEADIFASYFLMPDELFRKFFSEYKHLHWFDMIIALKRIFRVSYKTVIYRIIEKNLVRNDFNLWIHFPMEYNKRTGRTLKNHTEPEPITSIVEDYRQMEPEHLHRGDFMRDTLQGLVQEAYFRELITFTRAGEILQKDNEAMNQLLESWDVMQ